MSQRLLTSHGFWGKFSPIPIDRKACSRTAQHKDGVDQKNRSLRSIKAMGVIERAELYLNFSGLFCSLGSKEMIERNIELSAEFSRYLFEHPEIEEKIPLDSEITLLPEFDKELKELVLPGLEWVNPYIVVKNVAESGCSDELFDAHSRSRWNLLRNYYRSR